MESPVSHEKLVGNPVNVCDLKINGISGSEKSSKIFWVLQDSGNSRSISCEVRESAIQFLTADFLMTCQKPPDTLGSAGYSLREPAK